MNLSILPKDIIRSIFLYLRCPVGRLINDEIEIYTEDHNSVYTKQVRLYYIKNIMPFSDYYFDKLKYPEDYDSYHKDYYK